MKVLAGLGLIPGLSFLGYVLALAARTVAPLRCTPLPLSVGTVERSACGGAPLANSPWLVVLLALVAAVIVIAFGLLRFRDEWLPLFAIDVLAVAASALILTLVLTGSDRRHALTEMAIVLLPIVTAGFGFSAACAWVLGRRVVARAGRSTDTRG